MSSVKCPVCTIACTKSFEKPPATYYSCDNCHSMFLWPMPSVQAMKDFAEHEYRVGAYSDYLKAKPLKVLTFENRVKQFKHLLTNMGNQKLRHLDVGCSAGFMIEVGIKHGFDSYGVEFSKEAISKADVQTQSRIINSDVNQLSDSKESKFDLVTCFDIVEHVQDPFIFLASLKRLLNPGGLLVLTTPDPEHSLAKIMGTKWPMLQPMQHTIIFSKSGLKSVLDQTGFEELVSSPAYKVLTLGYLTGQLKELNPLISNLMSLSSKIIPKNIIEKTLKLNISEFMSVSRAN